MSDVAVSIPSCDHYKDLWTPFFNLFCKFWPDCKYKVYLGSNHAQCNDTKVNMINVGDDISWSDGLLAMIGLIQEEYIVFMIEDLFCERK